VIQAASAKLLHRMGMQSLTWGATVEGFGLAARGWAGDRLGNIQKFREAQDRGDYRRVGILNPNDAEHLSASDFTLGEVNAWVQSANV